MTTISTDMAQSSATELEGRFDFIAKVDQITKITRPLEAIHFKPYKSSGNPQTLAMVTIMSSMIKISVDMPGQYQTNLMLQKELFTSFHLKDPNAILQFRCDLDVFMESINMFGPGSAGAPVSGQFVYCEGGDFIVMLTHQSQLMRCLLKTMEAEPIANYTSQMQQCKSTNRVIVKASMLKEVLNELDWSSDKVDVYLGSSSPHFRLTTSGSSGSCEIEFAENSDVFDLFSCSRDQWNSYGVTLLQPCIKALALAEKTEIRQDDIGLLSFKHMIPGEHSNFTFVDYFVVPFVDEEEM